MSRILVIGDTCKDIYVYGKSERMCPDVPVPVFVPLSEKQNLGMAGNVYQNVVSLGTPATLKSNTKTVEKRRFVDLNTNHKFLRVDSGEDKIKRINDLTLELINIYELLIISDYNKGYLLEKDIQFICENHPQVFIDTKKKIGDYCQQCAFIKINQYEYANSLDYISTHPWARNKIITTLGNKGSSFKDKTFPVEKVEIKDLSGAGDTFMAALAVEYLKSKDIKKSIVFANTCATKVVQMKGVNVI
jgi:bifunctional ADP-heptose synthase (sugar kinase/adenylyltransferase)